jgi:hypothetical protein
METEAGKLAVIITGATGMVGEGVLVECLEHPAIERVLLVSRKTYGAKHPKLGECIVPDFLYLGPVHTIRADNVARRNAARGDGARSPWLFPEQGRQQSLAAFRPQPFGPGLIWPISLSLVARRCRICLAPRS